MATFFAAAAAAAAAIFSGLSLYVSGRREERRWRREQLVDAYQEIIDISFVRSKLAVEAVWARQRTDVPDLAPMRIEEDRLHNEHSRLVTRLRLLGPAYGVLAAEKLHHSDHELVDPALADASRLSSIQLDVFEAARQANRAAKQEMFDAARRTIGLGRAAEMDLADWGNALKDL